MSKETAKEFIDSTDLFNSDYYLDNDSGKGFVLDIEHLSEVLEAYHQERMNNPKDSGLAYAYLYNVKDSDNVHALRVNIMKALEWLEPKDDPTQ